MVPPDDAMTERTALKREGSRGLATDTYRVKVVQKESQSGSGLPWMAGWLWLALVGPGK
jgi:hypothetical protein